MKITSISSNSISKDYIQPNNKNTAINHTENKHNTTFGSLGMAALKTSTTIMEWIENRGYLISFLIQDGLGMTAPRVWTGFNRDREITGEYNFQEGIEVFGREGSTGPYIIGVAPIVLALAGKFCKSTNTNTTLLKRLGSELKTIISNPNFDSSIKKDANKFKEEFYKHNITKMYKNTVPNDVNSEETINYILSEFSKYDSKDKKAGNSACSNIVNIINNKMLENSSEVYSINKVYIGDDVNKKMYSTKEALRALKDFANDAITNNKDFALIDLEAAENLKNNFAAKRLLTNIANIVITLGGLSILPKIYARSNVSPGAKTMEAMQQKNEKEQKASQTSFKGKGINNNGFFAKMGSLITKHIPEKLHDLLEYTGYNFSKTTFALLATVGLLFPRGKRAWQRAQIDENGKRDMTEINEILLRDTVSSLSVVFAVPLLTKLLVRTYEDKKGFILTNRASDGKNSFKKALDIINPYSDLEVLSIADLDAIYGNIDNKAKLLNFAKFVDNKGGDLEKIISESENKHLVFNENTATLESMKNLSRKEKNKKIIEIFEGLKVSSPKAKDEIISKLMKGAGSIKKNNIAVMARGLNSLPGFISTVFISPVILGYLIPKLTYYNTRKANEKKLSA